jgi:Ca-activated chloride channel family protein
MTGASVLRRVLIAVAFLMVLLQPGVGQREATTEVADVEILVVIDRTRSMAALDYEGDRPRIDGVREDLRSLAEDLPGTRFALLTWGTDARLELPFTPDHTAVLNAVDTMRIENPFDSAGTDIDTPLRDMVTVLKQAEEQYPDRQRMLVFISDGENTGDGEPASFERLAPYLAGGFVFGYGTEEGAPMPVADDLSLDQGTLQHGGDEAISRADHTTLRTVAADTGTTFVHRNGPTSLAEYTEAFRGDFVEHPDGTLPAKYDLTWVAGLVLLVLLLWELHGHWRSVWSTARALGPTRRRDGAAR